MSIRQMPPKRNINNTGVLCVLRVLAVTTSNKLFASRLETPVKWLTGHSSVYREAKKPPV